MMVDLYPVLLVTLAGWVNRHQQHVIEYLVEENRVLKEKVKGRRLRLTDDQRRRSRRSVADSGRRVLRQVVTKLSSVINGPGPTPWSVLRA
jgi:putative transposase